MRRIATALCTAATAAALIAPAAANATFGPVGGWGGTGSATGQLNQPHGSVTDGAGNVFVADAANHRVQRFNGTGGSPTSLSIPLLNLSFAPTDVALDASGNIFTAGPGGVDEFSQSLLGVQIGHWDSPGAYGIAVDSGGNVYVSDQTNKQIHKYTSNGTLLGSFGSSGSGQGQFATPYGLTTDGSGNVYVADPGNNRIQKFNSNGGFLAQWSMVYASGGGQHSLDVRDVAVDGSGRVYAPDADNSLVGVFKTDGTIDHIFGATSGACTMHSPQGVALFGGTLYVSDTGSDSIKSFSESAATQCPTVVLDTGGGGGGGGGGGSSGGGGDGGGGSQSGPDTTPPTISMSGFPRKCARKNFTILVNLHDNVLVDQIELRLNGRRAAGDQIGQPDWLLRVRMPVRKVRHEIPRGQRFPVRIEVSASDPSGNKTTARRVFKICGAG